MANQAVTDQLAIQFSQNALDQAKLLLIRIQALLTQCNAAVTSAQAAQTAAEAARDAAGTNSNSSVAAAAASATAAQTAATAAQTSATTAGSILAALQSTVLGQNVTLDGNGFLPIADLGNLFIRQVVNDFNYTILTTQRVIAVTHLTQARTLTLPAASAYPADVPLRIVDESGSCSGTAPINIVPHGTDTIAGSTQISLGSAFESLRLVSNGNNLWTFS